MLKLGHITYSNCLPVHAGILDGAVDFPFELVAGIPSELNRMLYEGSVAVSPSSSIEYALNPGKYVLLPDLSITSRTRAMSIILESSLPLAELGGRTVALTKASATSVILLRIILEIMNGVRAEYTLFEQGNEDPAGPVAAILTIGDLALQRSTASSFPHVYDLGRLWNEFTGLPFVFALWQVNYKKDIDNELALLYDGVVRSKKYGLSHLQELAGRYAGPFGLPEPFLIEYWKSLSYDLGDEEQKGLLHFYGYAAEIGAIPSVPELVFFSQ